MRTMTADTPGAFWTDMDEDLRDPEFARAYSRAEARINLEDRFNVTADQYARLLAWLDRGSPGPLCIDGREYARRQAARKRRR